LTIPETANGKHPSAESQLAIAITNLVHLHRGLSFSLASNRKSQKVLVLAKSLVNYKSPSHNAFAGEMLNLKYKMYMEPSDIISW